MGWNLFETLKLYYATVKSIDDEDEKGKIQIQVLPELESVKESALPWAKPWFNKGMSANEYSFSVPPVDSKVWVLVDDYWTEFYYLNGAFIEGYFDYDSVKSEIDNINEVSETIYPNINFMLFENDNILFQNISNGDIGLLHKSGSYYLIKSDGKIYIYNGTIKIKIEDDTIETEGSSTFTLAGDTFELGGTSKSLVTYDELNTALNSLMSNLSSHTHNVTAIGSPTGPPIPPLSLDISASESQKVKTG